MKTFALALGGGGARGLAHIPVIEALDDMGLKPAAIAGTSIGALIGAAYAAGMRGKDIRRHVIALAHNRARSMAPPDGGARRHARRSVLRRLRARRRKWTPKNSARNSCREEMPADFSALEIPLTVIATDLHRPPGSGLDIGPASSGAGRLDRHSRPVSPGGDRRQHSGRRRRHQSAAVRSAARRAPTSLVAVDVFGMPGYGSETILPGAWESMFTTLADHGFDHRRRQAQARRARSRDPAQRRDLPHARFLSGERHPAHRRRGEGRSEGKARRAAGLRQRRSRKNSLSSARAFRLGHAAVDLRPVMTGGRGKKLHAVVDRAALGIGGAVIEPADAGEGDRARAHGARLERDIEVAIVEPFGAERRPPPARIAMISACAVGSRSASVRLPARARTSPSRTTTQPTGTSPPLAGGAGLVQRHIHETMSWSHCRARLCRHPVFIHLDERGLMEAAMTNRAQTTQIRRTHRQGDRPRRTRLAPRGGAVDRGRTRRRQRRGDRLACAQCQRAGPRHRRRRAAAGARAHAAVPLSQAARADDHACRSAGPADHLPAPAGRPAAPDQRRPARLQHRGPACSSPTTARWRACSNCRRPAGCGATACAPTAR